MISTFLKRIIMTPTFAMVVDRLSTNGQLQSDCHYYIDKFSSFSNLVMGQWDKWYSQWITRPNVFFEETFSKKIPVSYTSEWSQCWDFMVTHHAFDQSSANIWSISHNEGHSAGLKDFEWKDSQAKKKTTDKNILMSLNSSDFLSKESYGTDSAALLPGSPVISYIHCFKFEI